MRIPTSWWPGAPSTRGQVGLEGLVRRLPKGGWVPMREENAGAAVTRRSCIASPRGRRGVGLPNPPQICTIHMGMHHTGITVVGAPNLHMLTMCSQSPLALFPSRGSGGSQA